MGFAKQFFFCVVLLCAVVMRSMAEPAQERIVGGLMCMMPNIPCVENDDCCSKWCEGLICH
uniref:Venom peptide U1-SYTX-Sth1a n=1 Tax=Scytodes thoracica TaxID=1112478 RepID=A0A0A0V6N7_SCYTH|nr:venom peptide U1-SYTX-Sth1a [Scytodes thoracica]